jgi:cysteine synthase A
MSQERRTLLLLLGAKIILTPGSFGMKGAVAKAIEMVEKNSNLVMMSQFENTDNPDIHRKTTAYEIWEDTDGKVDMVVCGVGTGGTISGVGQVLKIKKSTIKMVAVEPIESPVLSGGKPSPHKIQGIGAGFIPVNYDKDVVDCIEKISSEEAILMARRVIKEEGIPVGLSSGAAIAAGLKQAALVENKDKWIVVMVPSYSERYLSTVLAEKERVEAQALVVEPIDEKYLSRVKTL